MIGYRFNHELPLGHFITVQHEPATGAIKSTSPMFQSLAGFLRRLQSVSLFSCSTTGEVRSAVVAVDETKQQPI